MSREKCGWTERMGDRDRRTGDCKGEARGDWDWSDCVRENGEWREASVLGVKEHPKLW